MDVDKILNILDSCFSKDFLEKLDSKTMAMILNVSPYWQKLNNEDKKNFREKLIFSKFCQIQEIDYSKFKKDNKENVDFVSLDGIIKYELFEIITPNWHTFKNKALNSNLGIFDINLWKKLHRSAANPLQKTTFLPIVSQGFAWYFEIKIKKLIQKKIQSIVLLMHLDFLIDVFWMEQWYKRFPFQGYINEKRKDNILFPWDCKEDMILWMKQFANVKINQLEYTAKFKFKDLKAYVMFNEKNNIKVEKIYPNNSKITKKFVEEISQRQIKATSTNWPKKAWKKAK